MAITGLRMDGAGFSSQTGGAVLVEQTATLTLRRVLMANGGTNTIGGAVYSAGTLTVVDSAFTGNAGSVGGGGIYGSHGGLTIQSTTFVSNHSARRGGAVFVQGGTALIVDSTFSGNVASSGGAVYVLQRADGGDRRQQLYRQCRGFHLRRRPLVDDARTVTIADSTFAGNRAVQIGGGIYVGGGPLQVVNATISGNSAAQGGGIATGSPPPRRSATARSC